ncbi:hypothetical protein [Allobranchiibius sp. GilTou73]|uniref:hypothetical protein n=1 Tax=Allobranchiibius sp. GilTou73 TaxID=2904523 RepID=UPI001F35ED9A|nr:hypothetical protein [Allobranchiibius sp. GilTou73]UIJ33399.1 hypothetical protein LVQ62_09385 [Allobranchiibius sp. GilTou73]
MAVSRGRWATRVLLAVAAVAVVVIGVRLSNEDIAVLPLGAGILAACAVWWFAVDAGAAASTVRWTEPAEYPAHYTRGDPAASYLRRLCEEATSNGRRTSPTAAAALQDSVRQLVQDRLEQRPLRGLPALETLPPPLERYLRTDPAPRLRPEDLHHIVTSIEEL